MRRWTQRQHRARTLAVSLLILALLPTPWPKVEYHNVRHHDAPGQVCEYHDHLLRWHPDATSARDVAVLHWHWAWPSESPSQLGHEGKGLQIHASLPDALLLTNESGPVIAPDTSARLVSPPAFDPPAPAFAHDRPTGDLLALGLATPPALSFGATFAPRASLTSRLHRWSC